MLLSLIGQQNPTLSGEGPTLKGKYEQTNKRSDHQLSKKTRTTSSISKPKKPAPRMHPYVRPQWSQKTPASEKDNSIHQITPQLSVLPGKYSSFKFVVVAE